MSGAVALYLITCLLSDVNNKTCNRVFITDSSQTELSMTACMGVEGLITAQHYWDEHPDMHKTFRFGGWACKVGNKQAPKDGQA
jgi:hypothetical protein